MKNSILKPILLQIRILKFCGGFPLRIQFVEEGTQFHFECLQGIKLVLYFVIFNICFASTLIYDAIVVSTADLVSQKYLRFDLLIILKIW
jgi:hypothetical protein